MYNARIEDNVTLCVLKPDAYERNIVDNIIKDIKKRDLKLPTLFKNGLL